MSDSGLQFLTQKEEQEQNTFLHLKYSELIDLYKKKLWHQFSKNLLTLIKEIPSASADSVLKELYSFLIKDNLELRISQLTHVEIAYAVVGKYSSLTEAKEFMERVKSVVDQRGEHDARTLVRIIIARIEMVATEYDNVEQILNEVKAYINDTPPTAQVHGRYFEVASSLYQVYGDHTNYYQNALSYLACGTEYLNLEEIQSRSFYICLASLLSEDLLDLGELLHNQIVFKSLEGSKDGWVLELIQVVAAGDLVALEKLKSRWMSQPDLRVDADWIKTKTAIFLLVTMACEHNIRVNKEGIVQLPLDDIKEKINEDPERLCMKALALGILKGSIDQVKSIFTITWIRPRSLTTTEQLSALHQRLSSWHEVSVNLGNMLNETAKLSV